ncbi:MAG: PAS domain-containing protein, partial [Solirubrobacteraceae bacterium]
MGERAGRVPVRIVLYPADVHVSGVTGEFVVARSLRELRAELEAAEPAALVLDLGSGGHGALDLLRERRARGARTPVLLLAPLGDTEAVERAGALGACTVLARESASGAVIAAALAELIELAPAARADASRAPAMLFKTDSDGGFTHFTQRLLGYLGLREAEARGRGWLERIHADDRGAWAAAFADELEEPRAFALDLRVRTAAG